jgi:hypothetical protein
MDARIKSGHDENVEPRGSLSPGGSPRVMRGMARRKTQTYGSAILADHGGRLAARHERRFSDAGPRFRRECPAGPPLLFVFAPLSLLREGRIAFGIDLTVVSQLLAGPRSGPGRSVRRRPGEHAARMNPRAPRLVPQSLRFARAPLRGTRWTQDKGGSEGGDKICRARLSSPGLTGRSSSHCLSLLAATGVTRFPLSRE